MSIFKNVYNVIRENLNFKKKGKFNSIPFTFKKLNSIVPGIVRGLYYAITASSGVGKTQLAKYLFVIGVYEWIKANPNTDIKIKLFYFALEESMDEFITSMISARLKKLYGISVSPVQLESLGDYQLEDHVLDKIEEMENYFEDFEKHIEIIDTIFNPSAIFKHVKNYLDKNGTTYYYKDLDSKEVTTEYNEDYIPIRYKPNDPNQYVLVVTDHVSLFEGKEGLHSAMSTWCNKYARRWLTKFYKCAVVDIHQQSADILKRIIC